jgi:DNA ligase-1
MKSVFGILNELNEDNGQNYKLSVLKTYKEHELFRRVLEMSKDHVRFKYNLSVKRWNKGEMKDQIWSETNTIQYTLSEALDFMEQKLVTRELTGNAAIEAMHDVLCGLAPENKDVVLKVLNRDLRINIGTTQINKVFPNLITKPIYMRCGLYNEKSASKINPVDAIVQLKADGTYREFVVDAGGNVSALSRSGVTYDYHLHFELMSTWPAGHYFGELTVLAEDGSVMNRAEGNGLLNSDDVPYDRVVLDLWDYVTPDEYELVRQKKKCSIPYSQRLNKLHSILESNPTDNIKMIETHYVSSIKESLQHCSRWMTEGLEGAILKDANSVFRDGTNPQQLKLKLELDVEVRVVGFQEGTIGTVREKTFGALEFATDDGMIRGRCSGFTDKQLEDFNSRRSEIIGQIMTVECNDLSKARGNEHYALSHPRFIELRTDKTETDTLERVFEIREMAMSVGEL